MVFLRWVVGLSVSALFSIGCSSSSGSASEPALGSAAGAGGVDGAGGSAGGSPSDVDARACQSGHPDPAPLRCVADPSLATIVLGVCLDLAADNTLTVDARAGGGDPMVAVNGASRMSAPFRVAGDFASLGSIEADNTENISGSVTTGGDWTVASPAQIGGNATVAGALNATNVVSIQGSLDVSVAPTGGFVTEASLVVGDVSVSPPLDCANAPDMHTLLETATASGSTFNALPLDRLATLGAPLTLSLGCDRYHLTSIDAESTLTINVDGHVVLVVDGDVRIGAPTHIVLSEGATLDLLIGGALDVENTLSIGGTAGSAWVGVGGDVTISAPTSVTGWLLAPTAHLAVNNTLDVTGAAFVGGLTLASPVAMHGGALIDPNGCVPNL